MKDNFFRILGILAIFISSTAVSDMHRKEEIITVNGIRMVEHVAKAKGSSPNY